MPFRRHEKEEGLERRTGETPETDVSQGSGVASIIRKVSEHTGVVALTLKCHLQEQENELPPSKPGKAKSDKIFPEDLRGKKPGFQAKQRFASRLPVCRRKPTPPLLSNIISLKCV